MLIRALSHSTLQPILRSHGWPYLAPCEVTDGGFRYPIVLGPKTAVSVDVTGLPASIRIQPDRELSPRQQEQVKQAVRHMLSLDFPLDAFIATCQARESQPLLRLARRGWGRMFRSPSAASRTGMSPSTTLAIASSLRSRRMVASAPISPGPGRRDHAVADRCRLWQQRSNC